MAMPSRSKLKHARCTWIDALQGRDFEKMHLYVEYTAYSCPLFFGILLMIDILLDVFAKYTKAL